MFPHKPSLSEWPSRAEVDDILRKLSDPSVIDLPTEVLLKAHQSFVIYGDPELSPDALARWTYGAEERRRTTSTTTIANTTPIPMPDYSTGLGKR